MDVNNKVNDENYIHICGWMVRRLKLKGNELLIYAIIYGFSQDGEGRFTGGLQYLANWTGSTKQCVMRNLRSLVAKGFIHKNEKIIGGVKYCDYYAKKVNGVCKKVNGVCKKVTWGMQKKLPNILEDNISNNINDIKRDIYIEKSREKKPKKKTQRFVAPSIEEVQKYCDERKNGIDAQRFLDYYQARGWMIGRSHIKDWKACVRTWERNSRKDAEVKQSKRGSNPIPDYDSGNIYKEDGTLDLEAMAIHFWDPVDKSEGATQQ